ncbi:FAD-dependent monooxygenase [Streptomyces eurythermus]|uniref:FAD-dependent monooxygenase n=1 Tax=Streptomyces eurythermus TaxID=42237 RepID=UPI0036BCA5AD
MPGIAIVGAGIAGLACGSALRKAGFDVKVYERADAPAETGSALGLHSSAVLALRALGVAAPVEQAGQEVRDWEIRAWDGEVLAAWPQSKVSAAIGAPGITVPRSVLWEALRSAFPDVRTGHTLTSYTADTRGVVLEFADGSTDEAGLLIAADGLRSTVRERHFGDGPPGYAGFTAWRGICAAPPDGLDPHLARQTLGDRSTFGMWPLADGSVYWVATRAVPDDATAADLAPFRGTHAPVPQLIEATAPDRILRTPVYDRPPRPGWSGTRTVLVGDAAHPMVPTTGQGASQALLDAVTLAQVLSKLASLDDPEPLATALSEYEKRRFPMTAAMAAEARRLGELHHTADPQLRLRRDQQLRDTTAEEWITRMSGRANPATSTGGRR